MITLRRIIWMLIVPATFFVLGHSIAWKEKKCELIQPTIQLEIRLPENVQPINTPVPSPTPAPRSVPKSSPVYREGEATYYTTKYCENYNPSCLTATGDRFTNEGLTVACEDSLELGSKIRVIYQGKSVEAVCNDRGNFDLCLSSPNDPKCTDLSYKETHSRILDLSPAVFNALAPLSKGKLDVKYEVLARGGEY